MSGKLVTATDLVQCTHAGAAMPLQPNSRVLVGGAPTVLQTTQYTVAGCALSGSSGPFCATGTWLSGTARVTSNGQPLVIDTGQSTCVATGQPLRVVTAQQRVSAT
jgi:hypothetical protein